MKALSPDRLRQLADEAAAVAEICEKHGETAGRTAALAQHRALSKEIDERGLAR